MIILVVKCEYCNKQMLKTALLVDSHIGKTLREVYTVCKNKNCIDRHEADRKKQEDKEVEIITGTTKKEVKRRCL